MDKEIDIRFALRNFWRKLWRNRYMADLRLIDPKYRHLYRDQMRSAGTGEALGILSNAFWHKRMRNY